LRKSERIKVLRRFVSRSIQHAASFLSFFDTSCRQLGEMQKRRMLDRAVHAHWLSPNAYNTYARLELSANKSTMTEHERIYLAVLAVCQHQHGLCMDVEEERVRLAQAIADALAD
jgi:hypothetical protein